MTQVLPKPPPCPPDPWPMIGEAWQKMQAFREMTWQVMMDIMMTDPRFTALLQTSISRILVTDPQITQLLQTMIDQSVTKLIDEAIAASKVGVTDGSVPQPGQIGEYIEENFTFNVPAYPNVLADHFTVATLEPGYWLCFSFLGFAAPIGTTGFYLDPVPSGFSNGMGGAMGAFGAAAFESIPQVLGMPALANLTVATPLIFSIRVDQQSDPALTATTGTMWFQAWRMR